MEHKYGGTKTQLLRNVDAAQSSIDKKHIPSKDIENQAWHPVKRLLINSHDPGPIMSPHICITFLLKLMKKDGKEGGGGIK
jgi:hypothetical protein